MRKFELVNRITAALEGPSGDTEAGLLVEIRDLLEGDNLVLVDRATPEELDAARKAWPDQDGEGPQIDDDADTSRTDEGLWVQAWVWIPHPGLRCPECGNAVHDLPFGNKLAKCWNSEGHSSGEPLAFDTMEDE